MPALILCVSAWLDRRVAVRQRPLVHYAATYAPAFVPLELGIWLAHYGFHFAIGGLTIVPVLQSFLLDHGLSWLGSAPRWDLGYLLPLGAIFPLQIGAVSTGFLASLLTLGVKGRREGQDPVGSLLLILPWALVLAALTLASLTVFNLPMEMRGAIGG